MLRLGILIPPAALERLASPKNHRNQASLTGISPQLIHVAALGSTDSCERRVKGSKRDSPCQPHYVPLSGYQGSVMGVPTRPDY
jgi:hypothetical protein